MVVEACAFATERLVVEDWHRTGADTLARFVEALLTPAVTRSLPPDWQGEYDFERATRWIEDRDTEGTTLLASEAGVPVGLVLLHEEPVSDGVIVRLGYLLAEDAWGRGLGSELIAGLVRWCRARRSLRALVGGVVVDNVASVRVLERNGFTLADDGHSTEGEREYRLGLQGRAPG
jgi:RimJ/RimL family protein N-acetyltransferase